MDRTELSITMGQVFARQAMLGLMEDGGYIRLDAETGKWIESKCSCKDCNNPPNAD